MKLRELLGLIKIGTRLKIYSEQFQTIVFTGNMEILDHSITQYTLGPYLDNDVKCITVTDNHIMVYC